jgi:hypothetical protein
MRLSKSHIMGAATSQSQITGDVTSGADNLITKPDIRKRACEFNGLSKQDETFYRI